MTRAQPEGFLAVPPGGNGPGVLVLHAWWGLNETMKDFCTKLSFLKGSSAIRSQ
jgi:carboxymethylenebutenolidase